MPAEYQPEIHVNAWIVLAAWESARRSEDPAWLEKVYPLISSIADAVCARADRDSDGRWHLRKVLPPDESVVENKDNPGVCDDSVSTNLAFRVSLRLAAAAARQLGREPAVRWLQVADALVVLPPGADGIIPEYFGYTGHPIKQADLILAFWPLESDYMEEGVQNNGHYPSDIVRANVDYYRDRMGDGGPLMSAQIDACIRLRHGLGSREEILRDSLTRYRRHVRGAFEVPYECMGNSNSLFLTACGGLIQSFVYGWFNVRKPGDFDRVPRLICA